MKGKNISTKLLRNRFETYRAWIQLLKLSRMPVIRSELLRAVVLSKVDQRNTWFLSCDIFLTIFNTERTFVVLFNLFCTDFCGKYKIYRICHESTVEIRFY